MALPSLNNVLLQFQQSFDRGRAVLGHDVSTIFQILVVMEVIFAGIYLALSGTGDAAKMAKKIILIGFIYWIIQDYDTILRSVIDGFLYAGQTAGSATGLTLATLRNPDEIFLTGLRIAQPALEKLFALQGSSWMGLPTFDQLVVGICMLIGILAFGLIAVQVFVTYLEYLLIAAIGFILIPFGIFKPTAFIAERVFGAIIAFGIKLMTLALIIAVSSRIMSDMQMPPEVTWQQCFDFVVISLALCFLALHAPSVALSLFSGSPQLTFSTLSSSAAAGVQSGTRALETGSATASATLKAAGAIGKTGIATAGAATGGAIAAYSNAGQTSNSSQSSTGGAGRTLTKLAAGGAGIASGVASGAKAAISTQVGKPIKDISTSYVADPFNKGLNSVSAYRTLRESKAPSKTSMNGESNIGSNNDKEPTKS